MSQESEEGTGSYQGRSLKLRVTTQRSQQTLRAEANYCGKREARLSKSEDAGHSSLQQRAVIYKEQRRTHK